MDTSRISKGCRQSVCAVRQHTHEPGTSLRESESGLGKGIAPHAVQCTPNALALVENLSTPS